MTKILVTSCILSMLVGSVVFEEGSSNGGGYEAHKAQIEAQKQKLEQREQALEQRHQEREAFRQQVQDLHQKQAAERQQLMQQRPVHGQK